MVSYFIFTNIFFTQPFPGIFSPELIKNEKATPETQSGIYFLCCHTVPHRNAADSLATNYWFYLCS